MGAYSTVVHCVICVDVLAWFLMGAPSMVRLPSRMHWKALTKMCGPMTFTLVCHISPFSLDDTTSSYIK